MRSASSLFTTEDRSRIAEAVADEESRTTAEIVPIVATDSGRYDRAEDLAGLLAGTGLLVLAWVLFQREDPAAGGWDGLPLTLGLPVLLILLLAGVLGGGLLARRVAPLRRLFTPGRELRGEVHRRGTQLFFDRRLHHTPDASGMLIYLSMFERRAVILADEAVFAALGQPAIDALCANLVAGVRSGRTADALCATIRAAGDQLAARLPRSPSAAPREQGGVFRDALVTLD